MPPHRPTLQGDYHQFCGCDYDGERTVSYPGIVLASNDSSTVSSTYYGPSTHTHAPPSTSPTSAGVQEAFPGSMDRQNVPPERSPEDFREVGSSNGVIIEPTVLLSLHHSSTSQLEQQRKTAALTLWPAGSDDGPQSRLRLINSLLSMRRWADEQLEIIRQQGREQPGNAIWSSTLRQTPRCRYSCLKCSPGTAYSSPSAIERHLIEKHTKHKFYVCNFCLRVIFRRDKVKAHYRKHVPSGSLTQREISRLKRLTNEPAPTQCIICHKRVNGWDDLTKCLIQHCRCSQELGNSSEDSGQNQDHDDDGGDFGGFGNGNGNAPGPASGGGSGMLPEGGVSNQFSMPSYLGQGSEIYGNNYCSSAEDAGGGISPLESKPEASEDTDLPPTAESAMDDDEGKFESHSDAMSPNVLQRLMGSKDQEPKKAHQNKQDIQSRKCRQCGHIVGSCSNCPQKVETTVGCHNCNQDRQVWRQLSHSLTAYGEHKDTAYNGLSDGTSKGLCIREAVKTIDRIMTPLDRYNHISKAQQYLHEPSGKLICSPTEIALMTKLASSLQEYLLLDDDSRKKFREDLGSRSLRYPMISAHYEDADHLFSSVCHSWNVEIPRLDILSDLFSIRRIQIENRCVDLTFLDWTESLLSLARSNRALVDRMEPEEFMNLTGCDGSHTQLIRSVEFTNDQTTFEGSDSGKVLPNHLLPSVRNCRSLHMSNHDVMIRAHKMLEHIRLYPPNTALLSMEQLHCCHESLDAINAELAGSHVTDLDSESEMNPPKDRHKRLSALRTRLRVISMLLMLQTTVTSMHQRAAEDDTLECSLDRKSMDRFSPTLRLGSITPYTVLQLLESLLCRMRYAWTHIPHLDVVSFVVDPDEEPTHITTILSVLIMKLCDFASCPMRIESTVANDNADVFNMRTTQTDMEAALVSLLRTVY